MSDPQWTADVERPADPSLPDYPSTAGLAVLVRTQPVGERPLVTVVAPGHPLRNEQQAAIGVRRVRELAES